MKIIAPILLALTTVILSGCEEEAPVQEEIIKPAKMSEVSTGTNRVTKTHIGTVIASSSAELTFKVPGKLIALPIEEGDEVKSGTVLAKLDTATYQDNFDTSKVSFEQMQRDFQRNLEAYNKSKAVSKAALDNSESAMKSAKLQMEIAEQSLKDTVLTAPFDGEVIKRYVNNFQNVSTSNPIVSLQNIDSVDVEVDVPATDIIGAPQDPSKFTFHISFENKRDLQLNAQVKSFSAQADAVKNTYRGVLSLNAGHKQGILPGMRCTVAVSWLKEGKQAAMTIPASAVFLRNNQPHVWKFIEGKAKLTAVTTGKIHGELVEITSGLSQGEIVVSAGTSQIFDGQKLRRYSR